MPRVSILMAVYNGRDYLPATMASMLEQTFTDFEFVIIDDGSTDGVTDLLRDYAAKDSRIKLTSRPNKGLTPTLNEGLRLCTAPLVARMDSDDLARPDRLAKQVAFMDAHPEVALLGGGYELIDQHGRLLTTLTPPTDNAALQQQCLDGTTPICHPLAMFRRDAALQVGGYDESYAVAQDLDLWLRLGEVGELACLPDVILQYRMHEKSVSERKQAQQVANMKRTCETAWMRRGTQGIFKGEAGWRARTTPKANSARP
ncbi:MAG: glycosyltransferase [Tepidisphaeraceae bacterium]